MKSKTFEWGGSEYFHIAPTGDSRILIEFNGSEGFIPRKSIKEVHEFLGQWLDETAPKLPTKPYAVIYAVTRYTEDSKGEIHRLVLIPEPRTDTGGTWFDGNGDHHSADDFEEIQVISEGIDLPQKIIA